MNPLWLALTESIAHGVLTVELMACVLAGLVFVALYARTDWWTSCAGRLAMGNMAAWVLVSSAGLMYRLGWQGEALTLLIPTGAAMLAVIGWWIGQLVAAQSSQAQDPRELLVEWESQAWALHRDGRVAEAQLAAGHVRQLAETLGIAVTEGWPRP